MTAVVSKLLQRPIRHYRYDRFTDQRVAVTGGAGAIGRALIKGGTPPQGGHWASLDLDDWYGNRLDVLDENHLFERLRAIDPQVVIHAAADKHAPQGEIYPAEVADLNVRGTDNVVRVCQELGIPTLVFLSTCKAAQPETVYGASKLVGERIVLNAGYTVARLYNVVESSGNVFRIWEQAVKDGDPCLVMEAQRRFIHLGECVEFILSCCQRPPGRYVPYAEPIWVGQLHMNWLREHAGTNPGHQIVPLRRGDREVEPAWGAHETAYANGDGSSRVVSPHD